MTRLLNRLKSASTLLLFATLLAGCVDTSTVATVPVERERRITFFLIDNSLSYNNPQDPGSQQVMELVKKEIITRMTNARPGDHFIVRTIQSESNQLSAMISTLNLISDDFYFDQPRPTNPIELKIWESEKREFEENLGPRLEAAIEASIQEFTAGAESVLKAPSNQTDFIGALLTCQRFFEKRDYEKKRLIIYSDMIEDAALEDESLLDLSGVSVEARFVTKPISKGAANTHVYFKTMELRWREKLNADQFDLYEVQNSF